MQIFESEREAGLAEILTDASKASLTYAAVAEEASSEIREIVSASFKAIATNKNQPDLYYLQTLLVSTGWNLNDDVFLPSEVWAARSSPEDKPFNFEHVESDIIGHITDNFVMDAEGNFVSANTELSKIPNKFHIITSAVLYKNWQDESLKHRIEQVIAEIKEGKWYVSMEAIFHGFDYALADNSTKKVIERSEATAYLTKHLRAYGGSGKHEGFTVGRVLRNITFSGKGLVRRPANPESIIFKDTTATAAPIVEFTFPQEQETSLTMATEAQVEKLTQSVSDLQITVATLTKERDEAKAKADADATAAVQKEMDTLKATLSARETELTSLKAKLAETEAALQVKATEFETLLKAKAALDTELSDQKKAIARKARVDLLVKAGVAETDADATVAQYEGTTDEQFAVLVTFAGKTVKSDMNDKDADSDEEDAEAKKAAAAKAALELATATVDPALATAGEAGEAARATLITGLSDVIASKYLKTAKRNSSAKK